MVHRAPGDCVSGDTRGHLVLREGFSSFSSLGLLCYLCGLAITAKCSYIPPCKRENQKNLESVMNWQQYWEEEIGSQPFTCYFNQFQRPDDVLLHRTHDEIVLLHCFLWPLVTFVVGVLIVVLTICAKSLAVKAEAMKKRKSS
nr:PREDICTED: calcium-activated potassium channel subunit beta-4 [Equus przewalskii]